MQGLKRLLGSEVRAEGLRIGVVDDFLVDESTWTIRQAIVRGSTRLAAPMDRLQMVDAGARSLELSSTSALCGDPIGGLRGVREIIGRSASTPTGPCGICVNLLVDTESWAVCYLVVNTKEWFPQRQVLVPSAWVRDICGEASRIEIAASLSGRALRFTPVSHDIAEALPNGNAGRPRIAAGPDRSASPVGMPSGAAPILR
ncbi:MAG: hypothetical protein GC160_24360 [Acidobacteria bacterium]|nr:hypothetical protein [Acidobacteriota bacterium]